jgi:hypothetical protein
MQITESGTHQMWKLLLSYNPGKNQNISPWHGIYEDIILVTFCKTSTEQGRILFFTSKCQTAYHLKLKYIMGKKS